MRKVFKTALAALCVSAALSVNAFAGQWILDQGGWKYDNGDGTFQAGGWFLDPATNIYYCFGQDSYMLADTITPDGYKVDASGAWIPEGQGSAMEDGYYFGLIYGQTTDIQAFHMVRNVRVEEDRLIIDGNLSHGSERPIGSHTDMGDGTYTFKLDSSTRYLLPAGTGSTVGISQAEFLSIAKQNDGRGFFIRVTNGKVEFLEFL